MQVCSWKKKSQGLFDFNSNSLMVMERHFYLSEECGIVLDEKEGRVTFLKGDIPDTLKEVSRVLQLDFQGRRLRHLRLQDTGDISKSLWQYLCPPNEHPIGEGEVFRLGKQTLRIKYVSREGTAHLEGDHASQLPEKNEAGGTNEDFKLENFSSDNDCRICLEGSKPNDPFIALCECSKSMPMHLNCVKVWLKKKAEVQQSEFCTVYTLDEIKCDICGVKYPAQATFEGKRVTFFDPDLDGSTRHAYIEMFEKNSYDLKSVIVLKLDTSKKVFSIGRAEKNDILIDDVSISRHHAELSFTDKGAKLRDLGSKYGSHLMVKETNYPGTLTTVHLQIDRFYLMVHHLRGKTCFCSKKKRFNVISDPFVPVDLYLWRNGLRLADNRLSEPRQHSHANSLIARSGQELVQSSLPLSTRPNAQQPLAQPNAVEERHREEEYSVLADLPFNIDIVPYTPTVAAETLGVHPPSNSDRRLVTQSSRLNILDYQSLNPVTRRLGRMNTNQERPRDLKTDPQASFRVPLSRLETAESLNKSHQQKDHRMRMETLSMLPLMHNEGNLRDNNFLDRDFQLVFDEPEHNYEFL